MGAPMVRMQVAYCCARPRQVPRHNTSPLTRQTRQGAKKREEERGIKGQTGKKGKKGRRGP
eukprot:1860249-Heterocapsa_arctica.AAC.1